MITLLGNALDMKGSGLRGLGIFISGFRVLFIYLKNIIKSDCKNAVYDMNGLFNIPDLINVLFTFI
ncbi:hypothetical protein [Oribacterium sp. WCC10]|uniref:hypothetical protein n=1 Tax=Oribacterium sp. WCC10 TaxID=1855343 RepID=UPI0008F43E94|nr:hypothetical protein [Oribacterium sp. WCC10]SFG31873.1 hypothetical protein SAMN05216356_105189 [Oribacterium sp. WCC10]